MSIFAIERLFGHIYNCIMKYENVTHCATELQKVIFSIVDDYERIAGVKCYYLQTSEVLSGFSPLEGCEYCNHIQSTHDGLYKCSRQRHLALKEAIANGGVKTFRCHAGLVEWVIPIIVDDRIVGFFCAGFVAEQHALENLLKQKHYFCERYGINEDDLLLSIGKINVMEKEKIEILAQILKLMVQLHFKTPNEPPTLAAMQLEIPLPEEYYNSFGSHDLKIVKNTTYREMFQQVKKQSGDIGMRKLREMVNEMQEQFCRCIADSRTVEAKDIFVTIMAPAYQEQDSQWRIYEVYKRLSRITKRLHDYFGYSDELDKEKFEIFQSLIQTSTVKEVRLICNDFFHLILHCFTFTPKERTLDYYERAKIYIRDHCTENLKVTDVALALKIHPDYLNRIFKNREGTTIKKYISVARVDKIKELLESTDWSIESIAESLNYNSARSLYRVFNETVGMTCGEYRLLYRQQNIQPKKFERRT